MIVLHHSPKILITSALRFFEGFPYIILYKTVTPIVAIFWLEGDSLNTIGMVDMNDLKMPIHIHWKDIKVQFYHNWSIILKKI